MHVSPTHSKVLLSALFSALLPLLSEAATELIDFGAAGTQTTLGATGQFWNNVTDAMATTQLSSVNLVDTTNFATGITLLMTSRFNGSNANGTTTSTLYPSTATSDSLFGNTGLGFNGVEATSPGFTLSGLSVGVPYNFSFYASRIGAGGDIRSTDYFVSGSTNGSAKLNVSENVNGTVSVLGIKPTTAGQISISLLASADNTNANKFIYLGALEVQSVPEPGSALLLAGGASLILLRKRRTSGFAKA